MRSGACRPEQAREVLDVWAPLASQLGVWFIKAQLEDGAFKVLALTPPLAAQADGPPCLSGVFTCVQPSRQLCFHVRRALLDLQR